MNFEVATVASIMIIDDDLSMDVLSNRLHFAGHDVQRMPSSIMALEQIEEVVSADLVFLDIIMEYPSGLSQNGTSKVLTAGMEVLRAIRKRRRDLPVIVYSATQDGTIIDALSDYSRLKFISKWGSPTIEELVQEVNSTLGLPNETVQLRTFIVHGHNDATKLALKNYLQNTLNLPEPMILHEQPNMGRTLIEKFEDYAVLSSIVFVLLTPDDSVAKGEDSDNQKRRARQNVIFEMGYFLGMLGRRSGRVLLLHRAALEIPSDISGLVYIDIAQGIEAAGEQIRREIRYVTG